MVGEERDRSMYTRIEGVRVGGGLTRKVCKANFRDDHIISFTFVQLLWVGVHLGHDRVQNNLLSSWAMLGMRNNI